jgi:L-alanine-DL-glutamate epimerase-like enolase superfamily enzyme
MHIAAGEAYSGYGELKNLIDIGQIDIIQFDSCHSGGLSVCKNISDYATEKGKKTAIHVWGSAVAINTNFHLALILGNLDFLEKPLIELEIDSMIGKKYTTIDELKESILEKPGIGIEIQDFENISIDNSFGFEYKW